MADLVPRLVIPLLALIFAAVFEYSIAGLRFESRALPQVLIVILVIVSIYSVVREVFDWRRIRAVSDKTGAAELPTDSLIRAGIVIVATALFVFALPRLGFYVATAAFVAVVFSAFGRISWHVIPFVAGVVAAFYVLFELFLAVQLPGSF